MSPVDRSLPDHLRKNWVQAYQFWFVNPPTPIYLSDMERLQNKAGITDALIVTVIERAIQTKRLNIMAWARTVLGEMVPYGITTPEEWTAFEAQRKAEDEQKQAGVKDGRRASSGAGSPDSQTPGTGIGRPGAPAARTPHSNTGGSAEGGRRKVSDLDALSLKRGSN